MIVRVVRTGAAGLPNSRGNRRHAIGREFGKKRVRNAIRGWESTRIPRIARLMALALRFEDLVRTGAVADRRALARAARVTESRVTQVLGLCLLAPDIQAELLFWPATDRGRDGVCEKHLRAVWREPDFARQRAAWAAVKARAVKERAAGG